MSISSVVRGLKWLPVYCLVILVMLFLADQLLGLLGFPSDIPYRTAHQENQQKRKKTIEFEYDFITNDQGLRYRQLPLAKPDGETRILVLGDSFTEGQGVEGHETFAAVLEKDFGHGGNRTVRFINAGMGGTGPVVYWRVLIDRGLKYDPDGVLICLFANDLADMPADVTAQELFRRAPPKHGLSKWLHAVYPRTHTLATKAMDRFTRKRRKASGFVEMVSEYAREQGIDEERIRQWRAALPVELVEATDRDEFNGTLLGQGLLRPYFWSDALDLDSPRAERKFQSMVLVLDETAATARERGLAAGVVYIPTRLQYDASAHADWNPWVIGGAVVHERWLHETVEVQRRLAQWAEARDMPFLDLTAVFRAAARTQPDLSWKLDGHWTPKGHQVAGKAIAAWIRDERVFDFLAPSMPAPPGPSE